MANLGAFLVLIPRWAGFYQISAFLAAMFQTPILPRPNSGFPSASFMANNSSRTPSEVSLRLQYDYLAKTFYYSVAIGKSSVSSRMHHSCVSATRRFGVSIDNRTDAQVGIVRKADSLAPTHGSRRDSLSIVPDSDRRASLPLAQAPIPSKQAVTPPRRITPVPLDPALQAYFWTMQQAIARTAHPKIINADAARIASMLIYTPGSSPDLDMTPTANGRRVVMPLTIDAGSKLEVSSKLLFAGIADIKYVRSMALVVHDAVMEIMWKDVHAKTALENALVERVIKTFNLCWGTQSNHSILATTTGLDPPDDGTGRYRLLSIRTQIMNTAAFVGSLFAIGLLPFEKFKDCVSVFLTHISELIKVDDGTAGSSLPVVCVYLRGLYLLLLHATTGCFTVWSKQNDFLADCKDILLSFGIDLCSGMMGYKAMERRWLIEICNLLNGALSRPSASLNTDNPAWCTAQPAYYRWDPSLKHTSLLSLAEGCTLGVTSVYTDIRATV